MVLLVAVALSLSALSQAPVADDHYYSFWVGSWHRVTDGLRDAEPSFLVSRGVNDAAFEEQWRLRGEKGELLLSRATRAWDRATNRWMLSWVSAEGLFQVWEGRKVGADWYIYREFEQGGKRFWSRQAWIPDGANRVTRVMERSFDDGKTWEPRSRVTFEKGR
jgi:hypothetical protein